MYQNTWQFYKNQVTDMYIYVGFLDFYQMLSYQGYVDPFGYMYKINIS